MADDDVEELLSELSRVGREPRDRTPSRSSFASSSTGSRLAAATSLGDVMSPETTRKLYEVTHGKFAGGAELPPPPARRPATGQSLSSLSSRSTLGAEMAVPDDAELDAELAADPCVLCFEDKVVLRSHQGTCIAISQKKRRPKTKLSRSFRGQPEAQEAAGRKARSASVSSNYSSLSQVPSSRALRGVVTGNPTEAACEFQLVGTALRSQSGVVKHGDVVALVSRACGRYLGVFNRSEDDVGDVFDDLDDDDVNARLRASSLDEDLLDGLELELQPTSRESSAERQWLVAAKRKIAGRREHWMVVEVENGAPERDAERERRIAAATARMGQRAKQLGYNVHHRQLAPSKREVPVAVRSSDAIMLRSVHADSLYLSCAGGELRLCRLAPESAAVQWSVVKTPAPFVPLWSRERRLLNAMPQDPALEDAAEAPEQPQRSRRELEEALVDELLFAMQGVPGSLVTFSEGAWSISSSAVPDAALLRLADRMLPLCGQYVQTEQFVQRRSRAEFGRVSHAVAAAMRSLLREYQVLLAQLEQQMLAQQLSIQRLWFFVQPSMRTLEILAMVAARTGAETGGMLLNTIHKLAAQGGDTKARAVYHFLIQHATVPYLEMLELWIYHGVIRDPYDEFMVCVDEDASKKTLRDDFNARYWDARYTLRTQRSGRQKTSLASTTQEQEEHGIEPHVPFFLARIAEKILTTGKYLNVVRECGRWVTNTCEERIPYSDESHAYDRIVTRAHDFASRTLLALLLEEEKLVARLRSLKHYFLLDQGDFFVHFMDIANEELEKPAEQIAVSRLQSLLEMCLRVRNVNDPFQEDLACELVPYALIRHVEAIHEFADHENGQGQHLHALPGMQGLHGVDAFTLDFKVRWPLSLVLSRQALTKYQLIFRHLFYCKHVERKLCTTWQAHQTTKELNLRSALGPDYCLRQRMLHFLQNFEYYVMFEVLEPRWHELEQRLATVKTVDELMKHHSEFLDTCLRECLLTHQGLLKTLAKIMTTCLLFAEQIGRFADQLQVDESSMRSALDGERRDRARAQGQERLDSTSVEKRFEKDKTESMRRQHLRRARIKVQEQHIRGIVTQDSYRQMIRRSQTTFDQMLSTFMDDLIKEATLGEYHSHLTNLCTRLDFNGYYHRKAAGGAK